MPKKILVADDSPTIRNVAESLLRKHGYEVLLAEDGANALGIAKLEKPDLIFLDNSMPVLSGEEVCRELKQEDSLRDVPVIMLLSKDETKKEQELRLVGADAFIVKPFSPGEILDQVKNLLQMETAHPSKKMGKTSPSLVGSTTQDLVDRKANASDEKDINKTSSSIKKVKPESGLEIIETSDLMENFELAIPASEGIGHGFEWFLSELQKEAQEDEKADSFPEKKPIYPEKKSQGKSLGLTAEEDFKKKSKIYDIDGQEKKCEELAKDMKWELEQPSKEKTTKVKPATKIEINPSQFDQLLSDLKERISERITQEVTKKISPEFLEKIIREEISKFAKESLTLQEK